ncbi:MAG TPA: primosomal protein N' [Marmoricola sp.]
MSDAEQPEALPGLERVRTQVRAARTPAKPPTALADVDPVARVLVDVSLAHLDRPFDYSVPAKFAETAVPGARIKVRFAGQDVDGFVLERVAASEHRLQPLRRVVSPEPVLTTEVADLVAAIARRYAGTRSDVLRLAVPNRHAATERLPGEPAARVTAVADPRTWAAYDGGQDLLSSLAAGSTARAVWSCLPGDDWAPLLAEAIIAAAAADGGVLACVPDHRDVDRLDEALTARLGTGCHVVLTADRGPAKRYAAFLSVSRGQRRIVIGTRAAAFAPVAGLRTVMIWDDGDDLYDEPRAPYPHTREVLLTRAESAGASIVLGAYSRSVEAQYLVRTGWARDVRAPRATVRERIAVSVTGDTAADLARDPGGAGARLPKEVFEAIRDSLAIGPVLVQTPRAGYALRLACDRCRTPATCARCHGPLQIAGAVVGPACTWCGTEARGWRCAECGGAGLRAPVLGDRRTAEELGRAFPGAVVRSSSGERVLATVPDTPALVVATVGAEPVATGGYAAVCLLDTWLLLGRSDLRAAEEAARRWANAAALVRPVAAGGRVVAVGDPGQPALQALVRWDLPGLAEREIDDRQSAHLPPASAVATLTAPAAEWESALPTLRLPASAETLGPVPVDERASEESQERYVIRVPRSGRADLARALREFQGERSARKLPHIRVQVDPRDLG